MACFVVFENVYSGRQAGGYQYVLSQDYHDGVVTPFPHEQWAYPMLADCPGGGREGEGRGRCCDGDRVLIGLGADCSVAFLTGF